VQVNPPTAEDIRRAALNRASVRAKGVAHRRLLRRQIMHVSWAWILPLVGLFFLIGLAMAVGYMKWNKASVTVLDRAPYLQWNHAGPGMASDSRPDDSGLMTLQLDRTLRLDASKKDVAP
jgi:hypothetical protein